MAGSEHAHSRASAPTSSVAPWLVLGLVIEQPSHGYEIKQRYEDRFFSWLPTSGSAIYSALDRLRDDRLIELVAVEPSKTLSPRERMRQPYRATEAGARAYRSWIADLMSDGFQRSELLRQIASAGMLGLRQLLAIVDRYSQECLQELQSLPVPGVDRLGEHSPEELSRVLVLERQRRELQAQLDWALWVRHAVRRYAAESDRRAS